jgi:hypothetical protein
VIEVSRPNRQVRRHGKTDVIDAVAAAGRCCPVRPRPAKAHDGPVEALRC